MTASSLVTGRRPVRRLARAAARLTTRLTTPLLPEDYVALLNPLWSAHEVCGRIEAVVPETADAATLLIRYGRGWAAADVRAGQWIRLGVEVNGIRHWRTFSLSRVPGRDGTFAITVKANPDGLVSRHLVRRITPGTIVRLGRPEGDFVLPEHPVRPLFLTAGSGITPVMAMLRNRRLEDAVLIHSARTPGDVIFGEELRALARRTGLRLIERHTAAAGRLELAELDELCPDWTQRPTWACGPVGLLEAAELHWATARAAKLHVERFQTPTLVTGGEGGTARFTRSGRSAQARGDAPLLEVGEEAGALMPSGCRMGICFTCVGRLDSGKVRDLRTGVVHGQEGDLIQTCVSAAAGPVDIDL
jgi:ferredoxin-NADP reductase